MASPYWIFFYAGMIFCLMCAACAACFFRSESNQINHDDYATTKGLIIENNVNAFKKKVNYGFSLTYIFNTDATIVKNALNDTCSKLLTLLNAYERILNLEHHIRTDIKTQIIKFYGYSVFSSQSIISTKTLLPSQIPGNVLERWSVGKTILISFDKTNPELYNIPRLLRNVRNRRDKKNGVVGAVICGICCLIIYVVIISIYQLWMGFYHLAVSVVVFLICYFMVWCRSRDDSAKQRAENYGTFRKKIQESENIYRKIRTEKKSGYIKMEMNNQECNP